MAVTILIPTTLRGFAENHSEITVEGATVEQALAAFTDEYPEIKKAIFDLDGKPRAFVNVFVGDSNIKELNGFATALKDGDEIMLIPAIAGGSGAPSGAVEQSSVSAPGGVAKQSGASTQSSAAEQSATAPQSSTTGTPDTPIAAPHSSTPAPTTATDATTGGSASVLGDRKGEKLSNDEILRYSRHLLLKEVGVKGQMRLKEAKVLIVGAGGLGAPLAQYLAAAGVGTLGIMDFDDVDATNLQRQVIYRTRDVGRPKVAAAKDFIKGINPLVKIETYDYPLSADNALDIISKYDVVADATDNFKARYLINDACVMLGKPDVFGAMYQFEGQATVYFAKHGPCYRCMYPSPPPAGLVPSCATGGVVGVLPGIIGTIQANEVIKLIVGGSHPLIGRMLTLDAWRMKFRELKIAKDANCPVCGKNPTITELQEYDYDGFCGLKKSADEEPIQSIEAKELKRRMDSGEKIIIIDVREPHERAIVKFPEAHIIPIGQLARRQKELDPAVDIVFICKEGKRSQLAIRTLREAGYKGPMFNLKDGINTWARDVDRSMPQY